MVRPVRPSLVGQDYRPRAPRSPFIRQDYEPPLARRALSVLGKGALSLMRLYFPKKSPREVHLRGLARRTPGERIEFRELVRQRRRMGRRRMLWTALLSMPFWAQDFDANRLTNYEPVTQQEIVAPAFPAPAVLETRPAPKADPMEAYARYFSDRKAALRTYSDNNPYLRRVDGMVAKKGLPDYYTMLVHLTMKSENGKFDVDFKGRNADGTFDHGLLSLNDKAIEDLEKNGLIIGWKGKVDKQRLLKDPNYNIEIGMKFMRLIEKRYRHYYPDYDSWSNHDKALAIGLTFHTGQYYTKGEPTAEYSQKRFKDWLDHLEAGEEHDAQVP